eukprot:GHUV01022480.1.p1 GENE.GHUV01022480.1~~GHUV01022480.1.p1  ORF type:complete len:307 (+),score=68.36 GHUV01022480.1:457-1377(+)
MQQQASMHKQQCSNPLQLQQQAPVYQLRPLQLQSRPHWRQLRPLQCHLAQIQQQQQQPKLSSQQQQWLQPPSTGCNRSRCNVSANTISSSRHNRTSTVCQSTAAATYDDSSSNSEHRESSPLGRFLAGVTDTAVEVKELSLKFVSLWRQFLPMLSLFFCLSFINTMLDSLKDTLVITAAGGGAFVIPYLTVYAVLPISVVFLFMFSAASHRMSRSALFNTIIGVFMAFFGVFAVFMYPNADVLHPHAFADTLQQVGEQFELVAARTGHHVASSVRLTLCASNWCSCSCRHTCELQKHSSNACLSRK